MRVVYCSKCHSPIPLTRCVEKESKQLIDTFPPHTCVEPPLKYNLEHLMAPTFEPKKSVQNSNELMPSTSTADLRDRRSAEHIRPDSSAPANLLEQFKRSIDGE